MNDQYKIDTIQKLKSYPHKDGVNLNDWDEVEEELLIIADWFVDYCERMSLPCKFTRIIDKPIPGVSVSDSHNKRAFDSSLIGWSDSDARTCVLVANKELKGYGAISAKDKKERVAVFEDGISAGTARHLHFQKRKGS